MSHKSAAYLLQLIRGNMGAVSDSQFEDIVRSLNIDDSAKSIAEKVTMMLREPPVMAEEYSSESSEAQADVAGRIESIYKGGALNLRAQFFLEKHLDYVEHSLHTPLPGPYVVLDANHGWMLYWLLNSHALMNHEIDQNTRTLVQDKIRRHIVDEGRGGIGSGVGQIGHCASTYASVLALVLVEDWMTLWEIRSNLYLWFMSLKQPDGSFVMHKNGESDTRSTYCVLVVASLLDILTPELSQNTLGWVSGCQTYEGGFAGSPKTEAHGGYLYCAMASYFLVLGHTPTNHDFDLNSFARWSAMRQHQLEGGLSGRTAKLVDGCYSYWVGASFPLLEISTGSHPLFDREALEVYILKCCQLELGGFRDKPGKLVDFYHTNYVLSGLSIAQHEYFLKESEESEESEDSDERKEGRGSEPVAYRLAAKENPQAYTVAVHPVIGIPIDAVEKCRKMMKTRV